MKKKIALATLAMIPLASTNSSASGAVGIVTANSLNVRSGASTSYNVLFTVKKNDKVDIMQTSNGWYKIKTSTGKEGWASSDYISKSTTSNDTIKGSKKTTDRVNMRSGAGTSYRIITTLNKGVTVEIISESNGWSKVKYNQRLGYISSQYLAEIKNESSSATKKEVNTDVLNVRSGPSTGNSIIGKLNKGTKIDVLSESNGWSKFKHNNKDAYVSSMYLKNVSQNTTPTPEVKPETTPEVKPDTAPDSKPEEVKIYKKVNTSSLNVRSGPGTNYSKIGSLKLGDKVGIISENNGWSKIQYNNKASYVSSEYLSEIKDNSTTPDNIPPVIDSETSSQVSSGATINNKSLNYTLNDHINAQLERVSVGGNVIDSSKPRSSEVLTTFNMRQSRAFISADRNDLEYFLNPDNFKNSSKGMLQFLRIDSYKGGVSASELNSYLNSLAPVSSGSNVFYNQGQTFINAAQKHDIDLVYLVSHAMWETAYGKSTLAQGQTITSYKGQPLSEPVTVYNFFGIGAIDNSANVSGAEASYSNGWTSIESTIDGSAKWIASNYIKSSKYNQNTIYKMKFNYDYTWHQYATDVNWANGISGIMNKLISMYDTGKNLTFEVPNYKN